MRRTGTTALYRLILIEIGKRYAYFLMEKVILFRMVYNTKDFQRNLEEYVKKTVGFSFQPNVYPNVFRPFDFLAS